LAISSFFVVRALVFDTELKIKHGTLYLPECPCDAAHCLTRSFSAEVDFHMTQRAPVLVVVLDPLKGLVYLSATVRAGE